MHARSERAWLALASSASPTCQPPAHLEAGVSPESDARCPACDAILVEIGVVRRVHTGAELGSGARDRGVLVVCPHWQAILPPEPRPPSA